MSNDTESKPEPTFRSYNLSQGRNYAQHRRDYHHSLYEAVIGYHTSTAGKFNTIVDIGCGPGTAVQTLAPHFMHAIGLDPSEGMITTARSLEGISSSSISEPIRFEISTAEELGSNISPRIADDSVDLVTAAVAAHWFDMSRFWPSAARVLKSGGTVALWTAGNTRIGPSTPNRQAVQAAIDRHEELLKEYMLPGNIMTRDLYVELPLPWTLKTPVMEFDKETFVRKEWGTDTEGALPGDQFFTGPQQADMNTLELVLGTTSPVTRWREAHPDDVGTERDVARIIRRDVEKALHEAGVERGKEVVDGGVAGVLLMMKKK